MGALNTMASGPVLSSSQIYSPLDGLSSQAGSPTTGGHDDPKFSPSQLLPTKPRCYGPQQFLNGLAPAWLNQVLITESCTEVRGWDALISQVRVTCHMGIWGGSTSPESIRTMIRGHETPLLAEWWLTVGQDNTEDASLILLLLQEHGGREVGAGKQVLS